MAEAFDVGELLHLMMLAGWVEGVRAARKNLQFCLIKTILDTGGVVCVSVKN